MVTTALGIDVSKDRLDVEIVACGKPRSKCFANSPDGWRQLMAWLNEQKIKRVHACLAATRLMPWMRGTFANMLKYSSRSPGLRLRQRCGVWANSRPFGPGLSAV